MPDNGTIARLKKRMKDIDETRAQYRSAKEIVLRGGSVDEIIALGIHPDAAKALMNPNSLSAMVQAISTSNGQMKALERQLAIAQEKEDRRNKKYGR